MNKRSLFANGRVAVALATALLLMTASNVMADVVVGGNSDVWCAYYDGSEWVYTQAIAPQNWTTDDEGYVGYQNSSGTATLTINNSGPNTSVTSATLYIGYAADTTGEVTVTGSGATYTTGSGDWVMVGNDGNGTFNVTNGAHATIGSTIAIGYSGTTGVMNVSGQDTALSSAGNLYYGRSGTGGTCTVNITGGAQVSVDSYAYMNYLADNVSNTTVSGEGSLFDPDRLYVGYKSTGSAILEITENAAVKTSYLWLDNGSNNNSYIDIASGGQFAIYDWDRDITDMASFMASLYGNPYGKFRFWNGSEYVSYTELVEGVDYQVVAGTGVLSGYAVLTTAEVPEPMTVTLLAVGAAAAILRRRRK